MVSRISRPESRPELDLELLEEVMGHIVCAVFNELGTGDMALFHRVNVACNRARRELLTRYPILVMPPYKHYLK